VSCLPNIQFFLTPNRGLNLPTAVTAFPRKDHYVFYEENEILVNPVQFGVWQGQALKHRYTSNGRLLWTFFCNWQEILSSHTYDFVGHKK